MTGVKSQFADVADLNGALSSSSGISENRQEKRSTNSFASPKAWRSCKLSESIKCEANDVKVYDS